MVDELKQMVEVFNKVPLWLFIVLLIAFTLQKALTTLGSSQDMVRNLSFKYNQRTERLKFINEFEDKIGNLELCEALQEEKDRIIFERISGISANKFHRSRLIKLYGKIKGRFNWNDIKQADMHLRYNSSGEYVKGLRPMDQAFMVFFELFSILPATLGLIILWKSDKILSPATNTDVTILTTILAVLYAIFMMAISLHIFSLAIPTIRANQMQRYID